MNATLDHWLKLQSRPRQPQEDTAEEYESQGSRKPLSRRDALKSTAKETKALLPDLLEKIPRGAPNGFYYQYAELPVLDPKYNPNLGTTVVEVSSKDSFDMAISLTRATDATRVCVLNMANAYHAGGGWLNGALAQEEELCYRSSLSFTLKLRYYPMGERDLIYSPKVVIFRESFDKGHNLMDLQKPERLPLVSVVSIAAVQDPPLESDTPLPRYKYVADRDLMKDKMRTTLRITVLNAHRKLVLGAFGCGAFGNPNNEVADCWAEVLKEPEFHGWWESIVFAVLDDTTGSARSNGNFETFRRRLHGLRV